jgi:hypothetical protein
VLYIRELTKETGDTMKVDLNFATMTTKFFQSCVIELLVIPLQQDIDPVEIAKNGFSYLDVSCRIPCITDGVGNIAPKSDVHLIFSPHTASDFNPAPGSTMHYIGPCAAVLFVHEVTTTHENYTCAKCGHEHTKEAKKYCTFKSTAKVNVSEVLLIRSVGSSHPKEFERGGASPTTKLH